MTDEAAAAALSRAARAGPADRGLRSGRSRRRRRGGRGAARRASRGRPATTWPSGARAAPPRRRCATRSRPPRRRRARWRGSTPSCATPASGGCAHRDARRSGAGAGPSAHAAGGGAGGRASARGRASIGGRHGRGGGGDEAGRPEGPRDAPGAIAGGNEGWNWGLEPLTPCMPCRCATGCATGPDLLPRLAEATPLDYYIPSGATNQ